MSPQNPEGEQPHFEDDELASENPEAGDGNIATLVKALDLNIGILRSSDEEDATNDEVAQELTRLVGEFRTNQTFETLDAIDQEIGRYEPHDEADRDAKLHFLKTIDLLRGQLTEEAEV